MRRREMMRSVWTLAVLLGLSAITWGCGRSAPAPSAGNGATANSKPGQRVPGFLTPKLKAARARFTKENAAFSQELFAALHSREGNMAFSPIGVAMSLTMLD